MVLADLGKKINAAFSELQRTPLIDDKVSLQPIQSSDKYHFVKLIVLFGALTFCKQALDVLLKGISSALLSSDVNVTLVANMRNRVKTKLLPQLEKLMQSPAKQKQLVHKVRIQNPHLICVQRKGY